MNEAIKRIALAAVKASNPVHLLYGTVTKVNPVEVQIHQKLMLTKEFLVFTQTFVDRTIRHGDKVVLIRMQGGQQFLVLDKVVSQ